MSPIPMAWWLVLGIGVVTSSSENRRSKSSCLFKGEAKRRDKLSGEFVKGAERRR